MILGNERHTQFDWGGGRGIKATGSFPNNELIAIIKWHHPPQKNSILQRMNALNLYVHVWGGMVLDLEEITDI